MTLLWYNILELDNKKVPRGCTHRDTVNLIRRLALNTVPQTKICSKCKNEKSADRFYTDRSKKDGLSSYCKVCRSRYHKAYRADNREALSELGKRYYEENKEQILKKQREYARKNWTTIYQKQKTRKNRDREGYLNYLKDYYHKNKKQTQQKRRETLREWKRKNRSHVLRRDKAYRERNPDKFRGYARKWRRKNKDKVVMYAQRRRARLLGADGNYTTREWGRLKKQFSHQCLCCKKREPSIKLTVDHVVPISLGGSNSIDNIQPLCMSCNSSKGTNIIDYR